MRSCHCQWNSYWLLCRTLNHLHFSQEGVNLCCIYMYGLTSCDKKNLLGGKKKKIGDSIEQKQGGEDMCLARHQLLG